MRKHPKVARVVEQHVEAVAKKSTAAVDDVDAALSKSEYKRAVPSYEAATEVLDYVLINMMQNVARRIIVHMRRKRAGHHGTQVECGSTFFNSIVVPYLKKCGFTRKSTKSQGRQQWITTSPATLQKLFTFRGQASPVILDVEGSTEQNGDTAAEGGDQDDTEDCDEVDIDTGDYARPEVSAEHPAGLAFFPGRGAIHFNMHYQVIKAATGQPVCPDVHFEASK